MNYIEDFSDVLKLVSEYIHDEKSILQIKHAYDFAALKHKDQKRKSGEPYLIHLINVAWLLASWKMGPNVISAGLLHDSIEDQNVTHEELVKNFNEDVANLVSGLTKVSRYSHQNQVLVESINMQKIILAMSQDIRIILIKIADRLHNINTLEYMPTEKQQEIAKKTQDIYLPIARRLGLESAVEQFNTKIFEFLYPSDYKQLSSNIAVASEQNQKFIDNFVYEIKNYLIGKVNIVKIFGRVKNLYSIYKKIVEKDKAITDIFDINAIRIIVSSSSECYAVVGYLQSKYRFIQDRFKDYIVKPKPNLYQSIHLTMIAGKRNVEIQIRTPEMDSIAKNGLASHWSYKEKKESILQNKQDITDQIHILNEELESLKTKDNHLINENDKVIHNIVFKTNIYVVTPKGDSFQMPIGSTALDFAFRVHSKVGLSAQSAVINDKMVPIDTVLSNGDIIEIKKSSSIKPNRSWLSRVKTHHAVSCIKKFLKHEEEAKKNEDIKRGEEILRNYIDKNDKYKVYFQSKDFLEKIGSSSYNEFFHKLANKKFTLSQVFKLYEHQVQKETKVVQKEKQTISYSNFSIKGLENIQINTAKCCLPIPGDNLVGVIGRYSGIKVHREGCLNIKNISADKLIHDIEWNKKMPSESMFDSKIVVKFDTSQHSEDNITQLVNYATKNNIQVRELYTKSTSLNFSQANIRIAVKNLEQLNSLINSFYKVTKVISVERVF